MIRRLAALPGLVFVAVFAWKVALFGLTLQPVPANDSFFYDGPVVNALNGGKYCNPSLALALKISGTEVFSAYPPFYQGVLWVWMRVCGTSEISAMALHMVLFGLYLLVLWKILKQLNIPRVWGNLAGLFLFVITFQDRPDSLAHLLGVTAIYCWLRAREGAVWAWLTTLSITLALATSLQLGAAYLFFVWLFAIANWFVRREKVLIPPLLAMVIVPFSLVLMVKFGFPKLWAGFQEHAAQTPAIAGIRFPPLDDWLKLLRTMPGVFGAMLLAVLVLWKEKRDAFKRFASRESLVTLVALASAGGICFAALGFLSANYTLSAAYLQPLVVAGFLTVCAGSSVFESRRAVWTGFFVALTALGAVRAIGMSTWGMACATDVSQPKAIAIVRDSLDHTHPNSMVAVSAAYLYEAARHKHLRWIHSDWLAPGKSADHQVNLVIRERPAKLILTQFDYYRRYEGPVAQLQAQPQLVTVTITNLAQTPAPDSSRRWRKVVQHVSWAPVIVELKWHK